VAAVSATLVLVNCSDEDSPLLPAHKPVIMPLEVGNVWHYADTVMGPTSLVFTSNLAVTGDTVVEYETFEFDVFIVEHHDTYNDITSMYLMRNEENGLWQYGTGCDMDTTYYRQMNAAYPSDLTEEWIMGYYYCDPNGYGTGFPPGPARCLSVDSLISTLAGDFECCVYRSHHNMPIFGEVEIFYFYAPDVGLVVREITSDMMYWKASLVSFDLN
jgi:hypothetical protein